MVIRILQQVSLLLRPLLTLRLLSCSWRLREQGIWSGRRSKQIDQPTGPTPVPSPIGRGVECEIPPIISELAVIARSEVWRQGEVITKDEG